MMRFDSPSHAHDLELLRSRYPVADASAGIGFARLPMDCGIIKAKKVTDLVQVGLESFRTTHGPVILGPEIAIRK
jgi:hypothetical protein